MKPLIEYEILEDGQIKLTVKGQVPKMHHEAADQMLDMLEDILGGDREVTPIKSNHGHHHHHHNQNERA